MSNVVPFRTKLRAAPFSKQFTPEENACWIYAGDDERRVWNAAACWHERGWRGVLVWPSESMRCELLTWPVKGLNVTVACCPYLELLERRWFALVLRRNGARSVSYLTSIGRLENYES